MGENVITLWELCEHGLTGPHEVRYSGGVECLGGRERIFRKAMFLSDEFPVEIEAWLEVTDE